MFCTITCFSPQNVPNAFGGQAPTARYKFVPSLGNPLYANDLDSFVIQDVICEIDVDRTITDSTVQNCIK